MTSFTLKMEFLGREYFGRDRRVKTKNEEIIFLEAISQPFDNEIYEVIATWSSLKNQ